MRPTICVLTWKDKALGIFSTLLYIADFVSDIVVTVTLYFNCHYIWAAVSASILVLPVIFAFCIDLTISQEGILHALKYATTLPFRYVKHSMIFFCELKGLKLASLNELDMQIDKVNLKLMQICESLGEAFPQLIFTSFVLLTNFLSKR